MAGLSELEHEKAIVAAAAAGEVEAGMAVGLGTGSTVAHLLPLLAARDLDLTCVATSVETERQAQALGLDVVPFRSRERLDVAIDGADQVAPDGWLIKGGGGAHTREKIVAATADRFLVIASSDKLVETLRPPVPLELLAFGLDATLANVGHVTVRDVPATPDGNVVADYLGPVVDACTLASKLSTTPGVVEHGLFPPELVTEIMIARGQDVERRHPSSSRGKRG